MKLLYLANIRLPTERAHGLQIMRTCAALASAGHEVTLVISAKHSLDEGEIFSHYSLAQNFSIKPISGGIFYSLGSLGFVLGSLLFKFNISRQFDLNAYDAIYTRDEILVRSGCFFEMHDVRKSGFQKRALKRAEGIVVISNGLAEYCKSVGIDSSKIIVTPDAVDVNEFHIALDKTECRKKLGLPLDKKLVAYSGHLYSWKGADVLARAAESLPDDSLAVFVGGTDRDIESFKKEFGSNQKILIVGRKPHDVIPYYLKAADVLVLPNSAKQDISRLYTSPLKLFEYMASGTPIVASDLPSIREILNDSNAVFAKPDDSADLSAQISELLRDPNKAARLSAQAQKDVAAYSWSARASKIVDFIRSHKTKGQAFYNESSALYSESRYPRVARSYNQFFFKKRLDVTIRALANMISHFKSPSLLEVGCADGIVLRKAHEEFGDSISSYEGIDVAPAMVEAAKTKNTNLPIRFDIRKVDAGFPGTHDLIIEVGVLNYAGFNADVKFAREALSSSGYYICSVAGRNSLWDRRMKEGSRFKDFMTYGEYESEIKKSFEVVTVKPVGLYLPLIWRFPALARMIQPVAEALVSPIAPNAFHEKVYILKGR